MDQVGRAQIANPVAGTGALHLRKGHHECAVSPLDGHTFEAHNHREYVGRPHAKQTRRLGHGDSARICQLTKRVLERVYHPGRVARLGQGMRLAQLVAQLMYPWSCLPRAQDTTCGCCATGQPPCHASAAHRTCGAGLSCALASDPAMVLQCQAMRPMILQARLPAPQTTRFVPLACVLYVGRRAECGRVRRDGRSGGDPGLPARRCRGVPRPLRPARCARLPHRLPDPARPRTRRGRGPGDLPDPFSAPPRPDPRTAAFLARAGGGQSQPERSTTGLGAAARPAAARQPRSPGCAGGRHGGRRAAGGGRAACPAARRGSGIGTAAACDRGAALLRRLLARRDLPGARLQDGDGAGHRPPGHPPIARGRRGEHGGHQIAPPRSERGTADARTMGSDV